jgi:hypothetical protein
MKCQFIEQHKQEFPLVVMCRVLNVEGQVAFTSGASVLPVNAKEKIPILSKMSGLSMKRNTLCSLPLLLGLTLLLVGLPRV